MKKIAIATISCLIVLASTVLAGAPGQFDWSQVQPLLTTSSYEFQPPVKQDAQGNYHIILPITNDETTTLLYQVVDQVGEKLVSASLDVEPVSPETVAAIAPQDTGAVVVWLTPNGERWDMFSAVVDESGRVIQSKEMDLVVEPTGPNLYHELRRVSRLDIDTDAQGGLHVSILGGSLTAIHFHYLRFDPDFNFLYTHNTGRRQTGHLGLRPQAGGQIIAGEDYVWWLMDVASRVVLVRMDYQGSYREISAGEAAYNVGGNHNSLYGLRRTGPVMALDDDGVVHIVFNYVTRHPGLSPQIIDVAYVRAEDAGRDLHETIITNQVGTSHFPTITIQGERVFITWEEGSGGAYELYYSELTTQGDILVDANRLTWEQPPSRLGWVFADKQGYLQAFWWRPAGNGQDYLAFKTTADPVPPSLWLQLGLNPYDLDNSLGGQIVYYGAMTLLVGLARVVQSLHLLLYAVLLIFILHKLQVLDTLMERPWTFFLLMLLGLYFLTPQMDVRESVFPLTQGFQLFAGLVAGIMTFVSLGLMGVRPNTTLNLMLGCLLWLTLLSIIQLTPVIPQQFAL